MHNTRSTFVRYLICFSRSITTMMLQYIRTQLTLLFSFRAPSIPYTCDTHTQDSCTFESRHRWLRLTYCQSYNCLIERYNPSGCCKCPNECVSTIRMDALGKLEEYIDHYNIDLIKVVSSYRASPLLPILKELSKAFNWFNFLSILQMLPLYTKYREFWLISWWCSIGVTSPIGCMLLFQRCKLQGGYLCEIK